ncbi:unnamed protein product [Prorocentrum cordatum]|uniref:Mitochondrial inner membrane protease subunit 2 n=1 Tax=Prorocentrum cordatum TaxID=2364126 RepID=A0ABN9VYC3_9DINO|nr:unnamed protein product [Polarella glacialis]
MGSNGRGRGPRREDCLDCWRGCLHGLRRLRAVAALSTRLELYPVHGRSMMPTLHGGKECCGSDVVMCVRAGGRLRFWPQVGEVVILVDKKGRMVKRLKFFAAEEGDTGRGWCWIEGDNPQRSEDSRHFGWAPSHQVEAVGFAVVWPPWRSHWLMQPERRSYLYDLVDPCRRSRGVVVAKPCGKHMRR